MTVARILTVDTSALGVSGGSYVEVIYRRATNNDSFTITPEFKRRSNLTDGETTVELIATTAGSICELGIFSASGSQLLKCFFAMPDEDALLHELSLYTAWPVGGNTGGLSAAIWGKITGTLSNQTDLWNVLQGKQDNIVAGTVAQYWRGDKTWQDLTIDAVAGLQTLIDGLIDTIAGKEPAITAGEANQFFSWDKSWRTVTIDLVSGLTGALSGKEPTITAGTTAQYWRGDKSWATLNIAAVSGLQGALDGKEPTITAGEAGQYWRHDKSWAALNIAAVANLQTTLEGKLENLESPAATGTALNMAKSGVFGRLKKIITSGTDLSLSDATDLVTITLAGSTLKLWEELSGTVVGKFSRTFRVKRQGSEAATTPINAYLAGAYATANATTAPEYYYAVSLADPNGHNGTGDLGYGAIDLQIRRDNTSSTPSGNYSVAIGHRNSVAGTGSVCISANANVNKAVSSNDSCFMGTSATITGTGGSNYLIGGGSMTGSSGNNCVFGSASLSGSASRNYVLGNLTGTPFLYSVLGQTAGSFSAEQNIILSSIFPPYGNITDRNMKGVVVTCTSRKLNSNTYPQQTVTIGVTNTAGNAQDQTWVTMTTNDPLGLQSPSTTNVYKMPHTGTGNALTFCGYVSVYGSAGHRLMKIEGSVYQNNVTFSKTHLGGTTSDDAVIDARVIESSGYLYIQFKGNIAAGNSLYGSAIFDFFELF